MLSSFTASLNPSVLESPINTSLSAEIVSGWSGLLKVPWSAGFCLSVSVSCSGVGVDAGIGVASGFCVSANLDFGLQRSVNGFQLDASENRVGGTCVDDSGGPGYGVGQGCGIDFDFHV